MPTYIAMLRGINVGAHNRVKMNALRGSFESLGFKKVQTYIQSGNVVFQAAKTSPPVLRKKIEEKLTADCGFSALVILRSQEDFEKAIATNPFVKKTNIDPEKLHVIFLAEAPAPNVLKELENLAKAPDQSCCLGQEIYLHLPNDFAHSSLASNPLERKFLKQATTRNWRTVNQIHQLCLGGE
jgi:uncharacterized protein (DUF1697 family)